MSSTPAAGVYQPVLASNASVKKGVKGGVWSSSLSDVLQEPARKSNCCALTCCGIFLSDRLGYWVYGGDRTKWMLRGIPLGLYILIVIVSNFTSTRPPPAGGQDSEHDNGYDDYTFDDFTDPVPYKPYSPSSNYDDHDEDEPNGAVFLSQFLSLLFLTSILIICIMGASVRRQLRRDVFAKILEQKEGINQLQRAQLVAQNERQLVAAKGLCCCYEDDRTYEVVVTTDEVLAEEEPSSDIATALFRLYLSICCGCCGCWLQFCGMCAIRQEDYEISSLLEREDPQALQVDYITFQKYEHYYSSILRVRQQGSMYWQDHFQALSQLSKLILKGIAALWALALLISILHLTTDLHSIGNFIVFCFVWAQSLFIMWLVYWRTNRLNISLDAVLKYFASGFVLSVSMALIYETLLQMVLGIVLIFAVAFEGVDGVEIHDKTSLHQFLRHHFADAAVFSFLFAFVVAALVEELWKYYGYWMVETPDLFMNQEAIIMNESNSASVQRAASNSTRVVAAANITIAMVAVATGFACAENMEYVFGQKNVRDEFFIILLRSIMPAHPLFAAIQSLGVVRRDVQGVSTMCFARLLFPAIIAHGMFDFVVLFVGYVEVAEMDDDGDFATPPPSGEAMTGQEMVFNLKAMLFVVPVYVASAVYYIIAARLQRRELQEQDAADGVGELLLSETGGYTGVNPTLPLAGVPIMTGDGATAPLVDNDQDLI